MTKRSSRLSCLSSSKRLTFGLILLLILTLASSAQSVWKPDSLLGGDVTATSVRGTGSEFRVRLPREVPERAPEPSAEDPARA